MSTTDFTQWAVPDLILTLGGHTFKVRPPSVDAMRQVLAAAARAEIRLGLAGTRTTVPDEIQTVLDTIKPGDHPALGGEYQRMVSAGIDQVSIDRMAYYSVFYWARGKKYADGLAALLWMPRDPEALSATDASPKGRSKQRKTGRRTASESQTKRAGTRTTAPSPKN